MRRATAPALRRDAGAVCRPSIAYPFLLDLPPGTSYQLNHVPYDSGRLARWFDAQLARRIPEQRIVLVRLDSTLRDELRWLIPAIEGAGAGAYEPDSTCMPPIRMQPPAASAI